MKEIMDEQYFEHDHVPPDEFDSAHNVSFVNGIHESLSIIECVDYHDEGERKYRCRCYLCGREYEFRSDEFTIRNDTYGSKASWGYYCYACCDCHSISSFQWRTIAILIEHKIPYRVEVSFPDLLSEKGELLRYDFAILNPDGSYKYLIECQGRQHFEIGNGYGGYANLRIRQARDEKKRVYAQAINVPLIEIPYTYNTYDKEEKLLKSMHVI